MMFSQKKQEPLNYDLLIGPEFLKFLSRIEDLEEADIKIRRALSMKSLQWDADLSETARNIKKAKKELSYLADDIEKIKNDFLNLVVEFKSCAQSENFTRLNNTIDRWKPEEFLTREEFKQMLKEQL